MPHPVPQPSTLISRLSDRVFIIAEAGVNHDGSLETALRMVVAAKQAGADAVKFQIFRASELATRDAPKADYQRPGGDESQRTMLAKLELSDADFAVIRTRCEELGIAFLATPFGTGDLERLVRLGSTAAVKIASTDLTNAALLEAAADTKAPIILSTGASTREEIREAVERVRERGGADRLVLLHCISAYPTPVEGINLRTIAALGEEFGLPVGLSDHTTSTRVGAWAVAAGARVLEKHFTLDRRGQGPDHAISLTPDELAEYVAEVRQVESALGLARTEVSAIELDVRRAARKSIVAARSIPAGATVASDALTLKRPGTGLPPSEMLALIGRRAKVDIPADALLSWAMVQ